MQREHEVALYWGKAMLDVRSAPSKGAFRLGDVEVESTPAPGTFAVKLPDG